MIILDANFVSELMRPSPSDSVVRWVAAQPASSFDIRSIAQAAFLHGILLLPAGSKHRAIQKAAESLPRFGRVPPGAKP